MLHSISMTSGRSWWAALFLHFYGGPPSLFPVGYGIASSIDNVVVGVMDGSD